MKWFLFLWDFWRDWQSFTIKFCFWDKFCESDSVHACRMHVILFQKVPKLFLVRAETSLVCVCLFVCLLITLPSCQHLFTVLSQLFVSLFQVIASQHIKVIIATIWYECSLNTHELYTDIDWTELRVWTVFDMRTESKGNWIISWQSFEWSYEDYQSSLELLELNYKSP